MLCCAVLCCAVLCCAVLCCAVLCSAVLCCAVYQLGRPVLFLTEGLSECVVHVILCCAMPISAGNVQSSKNESDALS